MDWTATLRQNGIPESPGYAETCQLIASLGPRPKLGRDGKPIETPAPAAKTAKKRR